MSRHSSIWWPGNVDVTCDVDDVIGQIPTEALETELKERKELQRTDVKQFEKEERYRTYELDVTIDPSDYDLINEEDVEVSDFEDEQIVDYLEGAGYCVFRKGVVNVSDMDTVRVHLDELSDWKFREAMCDLLGLSHLATKDDIINSLKERIR